MEKQMILGQLGVNMQKNVVAPLYATCKKITQMFGRPKCRSIKFIEKSIGVNLCDVG